MTMWMRGILEVLFVAIGHPESSEAFVLIGCKHFTNYTYTYMYHINTTLTQLITMIC